ncbi:TlpA family protein disulfide reductase [Nocardiopsis sp. EMB25]|uniref:TlpA family protein disulfide reductase n=1 Tax=Nocardiopsis TaxID=2013 RepID=UPI0003454193|nr:MULTISPECIES: TlpA disulfide reductase family protein [Nocardiopsis]MCY9787395.1 TlpA family protein disulfide reductase [Nocardiopsis sp. EMB25]
MPSARVGARPCVPRLAVTAIAAALVLTGCAGGTEIQNTDDARFISGDGSATAFDPGERLEAPDVTGTTLDGEEISLSDYEGGILVLNVWASWCGPCRAEQPVLDEVHTEYADLGVDFLGVNMKDDDTAAQSYTSAQEVPYPSLFDPPGEVPQAFRDTVPPRSIPTTIVIDPDGRIAARVIGPTTYGQLTELLNPVVVEFDLGDPEQRPRVAEQEARAEATAGESAPPDADAEPSEDTDSGDGAEDGSDGDTD